MNNSRYIYANFFIDYLWVFILILVLLVIFGVAFFFFLMGRRRARKQVKELRKKYELVHELLIGDCKNMITRIEFIALKNPRYVHIQEQFEFAYNNNIASMNDPCDQAIGSLEALIKEKQYRNIKEIIESTKGNVQDFNRSVKKLNEELSALLKTDDECRSSALSVKERFRMIKEEYNLHATELKGLEESFDLVFSKIASDLGEFEELVDSANYDEADTKLAELSTIISALENTMISLPVYNTLVRMVMPKRIQEVTEAYNEMNNQNYPLHHLHFTSTIENIENTLAELRSKLINFSTEDMKPALDAIRDELDSFIQDFEKEKEARIRFDTEQRQASNDTYELEKEFAKLKRSLPEYKEIYVIDDSYIEQINLIQDDITSMSALKRDLDSFIHSSTKQPYSILLRKMQDLQMEMTKITKTLGDFHSYLLSLKNDSELVYNSVRSNYVALKEAEYSLRLINVKALEDELHLRFITAYTYLQDESDILNRTPLDIKTLMSLYSESRPAIESLLQIIKEESELAFRAENAIVYGNLLRESYSDVRKALEISERSFDEADFSRATNEALVVIKKMRPDATS